MKKIELDEKYKVHAKLELGRSYLLQMGKSVGDTVTWSFASNSGTSSNSYHGLKTCLAEIKQHEDGTIYIQSLEPCKRSFERWNGKYGRGKGTYWAYEEIYPCVDLIEIRALGFDIQE